MSLAMPLLLLMLVIPVALLVVRRIRPRARPPQFVADSSSLALVPDYQKAVRRAVRFRRLERVLLAAMLGLTALLIARPQIQVNSYSPEHSRDIVLCLDVSGSMEPYVGPAIDALERVYQQNPSDRYSIVVFAGRAMTVLPLTRDSVSIEEKISLLRKVYVEGDDVNYRFRGMVGAGTDIGEGILESVKRFDDLKTPKTRNIILVSDLDQTGGDYDDENSWDDHEYLEQIKLVPQNRINMFIMQAPLEYSFITAPQQIIAASGARAYSIDPAHTEESSKQIIDQIFAQVLNTRMTASKSVADYPYFVIGGLLLSAGLWSGVVLLRWRHAT